MPDEKILSLLKKLDALAKRGIGGEKENAAERLSFLMKKYDITIDQIEGEIQSERSFMVSNEQRQFAVQVIASVCGKRDTYMFVHEKKKKNRAIIVSCTDYEFIEIEQRIAFYWEKYQEEMAIFYSAFIQKNKLFSKPDGEEKESSDTEMTPEEKARMFKMAQMPSA